MTELNEPLDLVNDRQVGGDHYKTAYQHWDFATDIKLPYLESAASKYVTRWRKKGGLQDLKKARHYIEKVISLVEAGKYENQVESCQETTNCVLKFVKENNLTVGETLIVNMLVTWRKPEHLQEALRWLDTLAA